MTVKFRKYNFGGSYSEEELLLPDDCTLSVIQPEYAQFKIDDTEEWTKDYIITAKFSKELKARIEDSYASVLFHNDEVIVIVLSEVYILSPNIQLTQLDSLNYILDNILFEYVETNESELSRLYESCKDNINKYIEESSKFIDVVTAIHKPRQFTENGIVMSTVNFYTSFTFKDFPRIEVFTCPYRWLFRGFKVSKNANIKEMYQNRVNEIYREVSIL